MKDVDITGIDRRKLISHSKFNAIVRAHAVKHYGGLSSWCRALGIPGNTINRCMANEGRLYPDCILEELGYGMARECVYVKMPKVEVEK